MFPEADIYRLLSHYDTLNKIDELKAKLGFVLEFWNKLD